MNLIAETDDRSTVEVEFERLLSTFKDHLSPEARGNILGFLHLAGDLPIKTDLSLNAEGHVVLVFSVDGEPAARDAEPRQP